MVYGTLFLGRNFVSGLTCTLKSKKTLENLKKFKNLKLTNFFEKPGFFPAPVGSDIYHLVQGHTQYVKAGILRRSLE